MNLSVSDTDIFLVVCWSVTGVCLILAGYFQYQTRQYNKKADEYRRSAERIRRGMNNEDS